MALLYVAIRRGAWEEGRCGRMIAMTSRAKEGESESASAWE